MRGLRLPVGLVLCLSFVAAAASAASGVLALENPAAAPAAPTPSGSFAQQPSGTDGGVPPIPPGQSAAQQPAPPAPGALPAANQGGLDLGKALQPDLGNGLYFTVGVGAGLIGLALASLLGTRFVNSENVLDNDARRAIFEYIKSNPGCHLRETAAALQLSTTNVLWHLRKLEESNLVAGKKLEGYKVFYPVEGGVEAKRMGLALAVLRNPNARQVLGVIARNPGVHQREIARVLAVNHGTVRWHLKKLGIVQLVMEVKKGAVSMYYISALGLQALERAGQLPLTDVHPPMAGGEPAEAAPAPAAALAGGAEMAEA